MENTFVNSPRGRHEGNFAIHLRVFSLLLSLGLDCGLNIKGFNDLHEGDVIESYEEIEVKKTL